MKTPEMKYQIYMVILLLACIACGDMKRYNYTMESSQERQQDIKTIIIDNIQIDTTDVSDESRYFADSLLNNIRNRSKSRFFIANEADLIFFTINELRNSFLLQHGVDISDEVFKILFLKGLDEAVTIQGLYVLERLIGSAESYYKETQQPSAIIALNQTQIQLGNYFDLAFLRFKGYVGFANYYISTGNVADYIANTKLALDELNKLTDKKRVALERHSWNTGLLLNESKRAKYTSHSLIINPFITNIVFPDTPVLLKEALIHKEEKLIANIIDLLYEFDFSTKGMLQTGLLLSYHGYEEEANVFFAIAKRNDLFYNQPMASDGDLLFAKSGETTVDSFYNAKKEYDPYFEISNHLLSIQKGGKYDWSDLVSILNDSIDYPEFETNVIISDYNALKEGFDLNFSKEKMLRYYSPMRWEHFFDGEKYLKILGERNQVSMDEQLLVYLLEVAKLENKREDITVEDRSTIFESSVAQSRYSGLFKTLIERNNEDDLKRALTVSELSRSRQLKELLTHKAAQSFQSYADIYSPLQLPDSVMNSLKHDEAIVMFNFVQDKLVTFYVTQDTIIHQSVGLDDDFERKVQDLKRALSDPLSTRYNKLIDEVSKVVIHPIEDFLTKKHIYFLSDGVLNTIPLHVLTKSDNTSLISTGKFTSYLPTMEWLFIGNKGESAMSNQHSFLGVADPVYPDFSNLRVSDSPDKVRSVNINIPPLPETRDEVIAIEQLFKQNKKSLYGDQATKKRFLNENFSSYSHIHIATHGLLSNEFPGIYEPALVFSDNHEKDVFLTASEVEKYDFDAKVCVLSACNTGSGETLKGEGVMGLSRSFMMAGCQSVVVSLWPVASDATKDLMIKFYAFMEKGYTPAQAMSLAQQTMIDEDRELLVTRSLSLLSFDEEDKTIEEKVRGKVNHPFFWAPFIVIGRNPSPVTEINSQ